jgi:hypothetical protein
MAKDKVYYDPAKKTFVINGVPYKFAYEKKHFKGHAGNAVFKSMDLDEYEKRLENAAEYLADNAPGLSVKMMIQEALRSAPPRELSRIEKSIKKKKKPIVRKGCVALELGGVPIYIVP